VSKLGDALDGGMTKQVHSMEVVFVNSPRSLRKSASPMSCGRRRRVVGRRLVVICKRLVKNLNRLVEEVCCTA
jgi:hypothetical protein